MDAEQHKHKNRSDRGGGGNRMGRETEKGLQATTTLGLEQRRQQRAALSAIPPRTCSPLSRLRPGHSHRASPRHTQQAGLGHHGSADEEANRQAAGPRPQTPGPGPGLLLCRQGRRDGSAGTRFPGCARPLTAPWPNHLMILEMDKTHF